jgi:hypothetical protein
MFRVTDCLPGYLVFAALAMVGWSVPSELGAAESAKTKVLEKFEHLPEKTITIRNAKSKVVNTKDKDHPRALELKMDYAIPGAQSGGFGKSFPEATLNPGKYEAFRFWVRSDVGTSFSVGIGGGYKRKDGKSSSFGGPGFRAEQEWKQIKVPFSAFRRSAAVYYKDGKRMVQPGGGEPLDEEDYGGVTGIGFNSDITGRGTSVMGHLMFDSLELVEKQK